MPFTIDERWIELAYGVYEGVPHAEVPSEAWRRWREDPAFVPEGGESLAALDMRVRAACDDLAERATRSHRRRGVARLADQVRRWPGRSAPASRSSWRSHLSHASICRIDIRRTGPVLHTFNETPLGADRPRDRARHSRLVDTVVANLPIGRV